MKPSCDEETAYSLNHPFEGYIIRINQSECLPLLSHKRDQQIFATFESQYLFVALLSTHLWHTSDVLVIHLWPTCDPLLVLLLLICNCTRMKFLKIAWIFFKIEWNYFKNWGKYLPNLAKVHPILTQTAIIFPPLNDGNWGRVNYKRSKIKSSRLPPALSRLKADKGNVFALGKIRSRGSDIPTGIIFI